MTDWRPRAEALAKDLAAAGAIHDPAWHKTFATTPRHLFVPRFYQLDEYNQPRTLIDGADATQRDQLWDEVYRNQVLVTHYHVVSGATMPDGQEIRAATSSASMPGIVATMLDRLGVADGHTVLEIGTGTGYNAALLSARLGDDKVTSIEVDPETAAEAAERLHTAGYRPALVVNDGAAGHTARSPYDRIIATCAVGRIPSAWIDQLTDDGIIVAPMIFGGVLLVLHKTGPGEVTGRVDPEQVAFMPLRAAGEYVPDGFVRDIPPFDGPLYSATTSVEASAFADPDFKLWLALHLPEAQLSYRLDDKGALSGVTLYTATGRAAVDYTEGAASAWLVTQDTARLWNAVEAAWSSWQRHDRPGRTRLGVTARADGEQFAWLDDPEGSLRWPLR
jgi:protein-L-isoaspartate(D-aspartate) O-methyltransferase